MGMKFSFPHVESLVYFSNIAHQQAVKSYISQMQAVRIGTKPLCRFGITFRTFRKLYGINPMRMTGKRMIL